MTRSFLFCISEYAGSAPAKQEKKPHTHTQRRAYIFNKQFLRDSLQKFQIIVAISTWKSNKAFLCLNLAKQHYDRKILNFALSFRAYLSLSLCLRLWACVEINETFLLKMEWKTRSSHKRISFFASCHDDYIIGTSWAHFGLTHFPLNSADIDQIAIKICIQ